MRFSQFFKDKIQFKNSWSTFRLFFLRQWKYIVKECSLVLHVFCFFKGNLIKNNSLLSKSWVLQAVRPIFPPLPPSPATFTTVYHFSFQLYGQFSEDSFKISQIFPEKTPSEKILNHSPNKTLRIRFNTFQMIRII